MSLRPYYSERLSEKSAKRLAPDTFRCGLTQNGEAFAMHLTFPNEQGLVVMIATAALPSIIAQLQSLLPTETTPQEETT